MKINKKKQDQSKIYQKNKLIIFLQNNQSINFLQKNQLIIFLQNNQLINRMINHNNQISKSILNKTLMTNRFKILPVWKEVKQWAQGKINFRMTWLKFFRRLMKRKKQKKIKKIKKKKIKKNKKKNANFFFFFFFH